MPSPWWPAWLQARSRRTPARRTPSARPSARPSVLTLEDRLTPSYTPAAATYDTSLPSATGFTTAVAGANDATFTLALGGSNTFNFYGTDYTTVYLSTNGLISVGGAVNTGGGTDAANVNLSVTPTQGVIAPLWDDWTNSATNPMVSYKIASDQLIVRWDNVVSNAVPSANRLNVEFYAVLDLNTGTNPGGITFHYTALDASNDATFGGSDEGGQATVGVKRPGVADSSPAETETRTLIAFNPTDTINGVPSTLVGTGKAIGLTWTNLPPVLTASDIVLSATTVNEGDTVTASGSFTDTNDIDPHTVTINWGDGSANTVFTLPTGTSTFSGKTHQYADNPAGQPTGSYTVTVTVADRTLSGSASKSVQVNNVAPAITAGGGETVAEGTLFTRTVTFTDVPADGNYTATVDYDDGRGAQPIALTPGNNSFGLSFTPPDDDTGPYTVVVKVTDKDGGVGTATFDLTVPNVNPVIDAVSLPAITPTEGSVVTLRPTFSDAGFQNLFPAPTTGETFTYEIDWNDGTAVDTGVGIIDGIGSPGTPTTGSFTRTHVFADNGIYTVSVTVFDDDGGSATRTFTATVGNVAPTLTVPAPGQTATEGTVVSFPTLGQFTDPGFNNAALSKERFFYEVDWGDGTGTTTGEATSVTQGTRTPTLTGGSFGGSHTYADNGTYTVTVKLTDDDGGSDTETFTVVVGNSDPVLTVADDQSVTEGATLSLAAIGSFTDKGFDNSLDAPPTRETFTYVVNWGDGTVPDTGTVGAVVQGTAGTDTTGFFGGTHVFADDGTYTVTVTVTDDDGGTATDTFAVTVGSAAPVLTVSADRTIAEGSVLSIAQIGSFTDAGFDNPANPAGATTEAFEFVIDWGDGTGTDDGTVPTVVQGSAGVATTGTFGGSHTYADNGTYTVTVTVTDDDGSSDVKTFQVTVTNAAPVLTVASNQSRFEGQLLSLTTIGTFTDRGYNNPLNPPPGETTETFTYTINWGDGKSVTSTPVTAVTPGAAGTPTTGSFGGSHTYADGGVYTVTVTVTDDNGGADTETFTVTVSNVAPTLTVATNQTVDEGEVLSLATLGSFTDPGFDNIQNPAADKSERFSYVVDWGDGTVDPSRAAAVTTPGSPGTPTAGSFGGSHTYADDGVYTVTVTLTDDNGGSDVRTFQVTVANQDPVLAPIADRTGIEGAVVSVPGIGAFTDKGYDNPANPLPTGPTVETFTYAINWGDGTAADTGAATVTGVGSAGVLTTGAFDGSHTYADNGTYTVTVTVFDDNGGSDVQTFEIEIANADPVLAAISNQSVTEGSQLSLSPLGSFTDAGFDNSANPGAEKSETFTYTVTWGDGAGVTDVPVTAVTPGGVGVATTGTFPGTHTYADNGTYTVTVTVKDDDGGSATRTFQVTVANAAPVLSVVGDQTADEGQALTLPALGTFIDAGFSNPGGTPPTAETFTYAVNWGDGKSDTGPVTGVVNGSAGVLTSGTIAGSHTYADGGVYTVTVTVTDDNGGADTETFTVTVANVAPTFTLNPALGTPLTGTEGSAVVLPDIGTFTDPGFDNPLNPAADKTERFTYTVNWGDGSTLSTGPAGVTTPGAAGTPTAGGFGTNHVFLDEGTYTVTASVTDDNGGVSTAFTFQVEIANVAPSALVVTPSVAVPTEGTPFTLAGSFADPGVLDTHTVRVVWGDGTPDTVANLAAAGVTTFAGLTHTYRDNGVYPVVVTVTDDSGEFVTLPRSLTAGNAAPAVTVPPIADTRVGRPVTVTAVVADLGADDAPATSWVVTDPRGQVVATGVGKTAAFTPVRAGTFTVTFTATDKDGGTTTAAGLSRVFTNELVATGVGGGGGAVQVFNPDLSGRAGINVFPGFVGGVRTATADVTGDGIDDVIAGAGPGAAAQVAVFDGVTGRELVRFDAFKNQDGSAFTGGVYVAGGDVDGDGLAEVVVTPDLGGGPVVAVYRGSAIRAGQTTQLIQFNGILDPTFRGGARAAVGDVNGDGFADIAVAAGFQGGPRISLWDGRTLATGTTPSTPFADFFAFEETLRNGAFVAIGDVNGDRKADLVVGGGPGGGPRVRVIDAAKLIAPGAGFGSLDGNLSGTQLANFFALDPANPNRNSTGGVRVAAADLDEDGFAEIVTGTGDGQAGVALVFRGADVLRQVNPLVPSALRPFDQSLLFGVYVG